jgi:hypothetical protein
MQLDLDKSTASLVAKNPAATPVWLDPVAEVKADTVCTGTTCKPLGKKLVAALVKAHTDNTAIAATVNLKAVVVGPVAWSVAGDRPIKLAAPVGLKPNIGKNNNKPLAVTHIDVAGDLLLVHWENCVDGSCTRVLVTDTTGRAIGQHHGGGGLAPIELDPEVGFVTVSEHGSVEFYDLKTGKFDGAVELAARPIAAVRIDKFTVAVLYETFADANSFHVANVAWNVEPGMKASMDLPRCTK